MKAGTRSMQLGRRGFCAAVDAPLDRPPERRRVRSAATVATCVLVTVSVVELVWIVVR